MLVKDLIEILSTKRGSSYVYLKGSRDNEYLALVHVRTDETRDVFLEPMRKKEVDLDRDGFVSNLKVIEQKTQEILQKLPLSK